jgi:MSHA biogenesis protein MshI
MTQQVNLFQPVFPLEGLPLAPVRMGQIAGAFLLALAVATVWVTLSSWSNGRLVSRLEDELSRRQAAAAALEERLAAHLDTQALDARRDALSAELGSKQRILSMLTDQRVSNERGFSANLLGVSRRWIEGVWLRGFEFDEGGQVVSIRGSALRAELIPRFLQRLGEEPAYQGKEFHTFVLRRSEGDIRAIDFEVSNKAEEES